MTPPDHPPKTGLGLSTDEMLEILKVAPIDGIGLHPDGSKYVFIVRLAHGDDQPDEETGAEETPFLAIYKPQAGERPLRDFPTGTLYLREAAAYEFSVALGWPDIPPTVTREGPHGVGSVQQFIDAAPEANFFTMRDENLEQFEVVALFDLIVNNADRKGGALLRDSDNSVWAIDHGLTFNPDARLRTVIWEFSGDSISENLLDDLERVLPDLTPGGSLAVSLGQFLDEADVAALQSRIANILETREFPLLDPDQNVPWPFV